MFPFEEDDKLMPLEHVAQRYGMTPLQMGQEIMRGRVKAIKIGHSIYFREDDLIDYEIRKETVYGQKRGT